MERAQVQRPSPGTMKTSRRFVDSSRVDAVNKSSERLAGNSAAFHFEGLVKYLLKCKNSSPGNKAHLSTIRNVLWQHKTSEIWVNYHWSNSL